tara:strand:+ start:5492 stop:7051 length:1560 start_codon:yes stop_codon:yes gene_type:complete
VNRSDAISILADNSNHWDIIVIGGGATGLGAAVDAASRGYRVLLLEAEDFAKGTSSRSTKLVHGGVRYLQQGNISLVREALYERGLLYRNAPHLVHSLGFVIPIYAWWGAPFYGFGMKVYDTLAGKLNLAPSKVLSHKETLKRIPTVESSGLKRGVLYYDGQFDDARLAINLAQTVVDHGGAVLNYMPVRGLLKDQGRVVGVLAEDLETGTSYEIRSKVVINATGVFCDSIRSMDNREHPPIIAPSQGVHLVLPKRFLPGDNAIMIPHTSDGRVLFAIPWHGHAVVGTTDTPVKTIAQEPRPLAEELDFLLTHARKYLSKKPDASDVQSIFAGLRPLVRAKGVQETKALSREHTILVSDSRLITIVGGKWTTYRKMAEDVINRAEKVVNLGTRPSQTPHLRLHGAVDSVSSTPLSLYGSDEPAIQSLINTHTSLAEPLVLGLPYTRAELVWSAKHEMARTVEDVLARRTRALFLNAPASIAAAPTVAELLANTLGKDKAWADASAKAFIELAQGYTYSV